LCFLIEEIENYAQAASSDRTRSEKVSFISRGKIKPLTTVVPGRERGILKEVSLFQKVKIDLLQ
jgi:hypothetical protein